MIYRSTTPSPATQRRVRKVGGRLSSPNILGVSKDVLHIAATASADKICALYVESGEFRNDRPKVTGYLRRPVAVKPQCYKFCEIQGKCLAELNLKLKFPSMRLRNLNEKSLPSHFLGGSKFPTHQFPIEHLPLQRRERSRNPVAPHLMPQHN